MPELFEHADAAQLQEASRQQEQLRQHVVEHDALPATVATVAGVDVAYEKDGHRLVAAVAVLDADTLQVRHVATYHGEVEFPYVPGLFSFRELPAVLAALRQLPAPPDLIVCDGHGRAHPRRFGLACHLGVATGLPTIGCAKTRLVGTHAAVAEARGSCADLLDQNERIGQVVRTQTGKNPVYVSVGHRVSLATAVQWVLRLTPHYRLPETTRAADQAVNAIMRTHVKS